MKTESGSLKMDGLVCLWSMFAVIFFALALGFLDAGVWGNGVATAACGSVCWYIGERLRWNLCQRRTLSD